MKLIWKGETLTEIDPDILVENAPQYKRPFTKLGPQNRVPTRDELKAASLDGATSGTATLKKILGNIRGTNRDWIHRQYDSRVGASTARDCVDSVGVVRLKDTGRGLGIVLGCRPHVMRFDARVGGVDSIAYPALELAIKGFETLAVTDCLNFGNPERENVMSDFVAALDGMNSICSGITAPIISGNVSFYNETMGKGITPTPSTGLIGLRRSVLDMPRDSFSRADLEVYIVRLPGMMTGGTYQELTSKKVTGMGELDPKAVCSMIFGLRKLSDVQGVESTRMVGKFGLAYAFTRMSDHGIGVRIDGSALKTIRPELDSAALFEEHLYEAVFAVDKARAAAFEAEFATVKQSCAILELHRLGQTVAGKLEIGSFIESDTASLQAAYKTGWRANFESHQS